MATRYWKPRQVNTAQVSTGSIDSVDATPANNTFTVTIGTVAISVVGVTDVATTATNLRTALNNSTHPYFAAITWSGSSGDITGTADTAGAPFVAALTETGAGTGTVTDFSDTTANTSPHDANDTANWSGETKPTTGDTIIIGQTNISILYGLEGIADAAKLVVSNSFTGAIGLEQYAFATTADGATLDTSVTEYRAHYFRCDLQEIILGREDGLGTFPSGVVGGAPAVTGSARIKINNDRAGASTLRVVNTASNAATNKPAVRYLAAHANADVEVFSAPGGVGIAVEEPDETSTVGDIRVLDAAAAASRVIVGAGVTLTNYEQRGGANVLCAASGTTINSAEVNGGTLDIVGEDFLISSLTMNAGTCRDEHVRAAGVEWTSLNMNGGTLDLTGTFEARAATNIVWNGGAIQSDWDAFSYTSLTEPTGLHQFNVTSLT